MTKIYGHRGAKGERPENTLEGFIHAAALDGVAGVECDIALTRDFIPVVHHDPELPLGGLIRNLNFEILRQLAPHVPTLVEALAAAPDLEWLIEIKTFPDASEKSHAPRTVAEAVVAVLKQAEKLRQAYILAFDWRVLSAARCTPDLRIICLTEPQTENRRDIWWGDEMSQTPTPDAVAQAQAFGWAPFHGTLTAAEVRRAHDLGLKVFPWTVNVPGEFQRLISRVDGIITDFPSRFAARTSCASSPPGVSPRVD